MTRYSDRDPKGRLPLPPDGEPACGEPLVFDLKVTCQAAPGHPPPCRSYGAGGRYEWFTQPDQPWPTVRVSAP